MNPEDEIAQIAELIYKPNMRSDNYEADVALLLGIGSDDLGAGQRAGQGVRSALGAAAHSALKNHPKVA